MRERQRHLVQVSGRPAPPAQGVAIGGRFEFQRELGGGGMAVVYEVLDRKRSQRVALKRLHLHARVERERRARALFEHEYYTLSQLKHPRIVSVYDYGIDELGPYYTMELLDGGDLKQLTRTDPERLVQVAMDVCSALSLLHSRRLLHRDVSPRNVRCTSDGTAKLIDFGVMTHIGPNKDLVGTPAYAAPELVNLQPLDARTDLYALGATLYYALTGRHAFPARDFASLQHIWHKTLSRPSELVSGISEELDSLVLDLLQLEPKDRPRSAAEVMDRLAALDGRRSVQALQVEVQAYLSTPVFVGREAELSRVRSKLQRTRAGRGSATLVEAAPGLGRSRFLAAAVLSAKLLGTTVLRVYADDSAFDDYGALRTLLLQLQAALPGPTAAAAHSQLPVLGHVVPELGGDAEIALRQFDDPSAFRPQLQQALRQLLLTIASEHPLLIGIDDLPLLDEPSVAALALLAREVGDVAIQLVATAPADYAGATDSAFRVYAGLASRITLRALSAEQAHSLLASVFGDGPDLDSLVQPLMQRTQGNPRDLLRLSQHLVDRGVVRFRGGAWSLPTHLDPSDLPTSIAQVLRATADALDEGARVLGGTFALCADHGFGFEECRVLAVHEDPTRLASELGALVSAEVLRASGERYSLSDRAYVPVLLTLLDKAQTKAAHERLAEAFRQRGDDSFRVAQHLLRAGHPEQALDAFVAHAVDSQALTDQNPDAFYKMLRWLPDDWLATYEEVLALGQQLTRPRSQLFALRSRLAGIVGTTGLLATTHVSELIADLARVVGLEDYAALDPGLDAAERLSQALGAAQARYRAAPESERVCDPVTAIRALSTSMIHAMGMFAPRLDAAGLSTLPSLAPLAILTPALSVVAQLSDGVHARLTGRMDRALDVYKRILDRTAQPDRAGLDPSHHRFTRMSVMSVIAMIEASMGLSSSMRWADLIETDPLFQVNALQVRVLYRLSQGNCLQAEREQREVDAARIESGARHNQEKTHLLWQVTAHAGMEDLTRLRRTLEEIKRSGEDFPGWRPVISYATAEYQRARGDVRRALVELQDTLAVLAAGEHQIWPSLAAAHVRALDDARKSAQAVEVGRRYCAEAEQAEIGFGALFIALPLSVAEAKLGLAEGAQRAEQVIERFKTRGTTGLSLSLAYEARMRVAIAQRDPEAFLRFAAAYEQDCLSSGGEALAAKLHRLKREAARKQLIVAQSADPALGQQTVKSKLLMCSGAAERAHVMLAVLATSCGAGEGFLYLNRDGGPAWVASVGSRAAPPEALDGMARDFMAAQSNVDLDVTADVTPEEGTTEWDSLGEAAYQPVLLSHFDERGVQQVTGLLVLLVNPEQKIVRSDFATQMSRVAVEIGDSVPISILGADEDDEEV